MVRGSEIKQSKSQLNNQKHSLNLNLNQMSEPSRKSNQAIQKAKVKNNIVLNFNNQGMLDEKFGAEISSA